MITISRQELQKIVRDTVVDTARSIRAEMFSPYMQEVDLRQLLCDQNTGKPASYHQVNNFIKKYNPVVMKVLGKRVFLKKNIEQILDNCVVKSKLKRA